VSLPVTTTPSWRRFGAARGCVRRPVMNERYTAAGGTGVVLAEWAGGFDRER
jgi:hypothetical protein